MPQAGSLPVLAHCCLTGPPAARRASPPYATSVTSSPHIAARALGARTGRAGAALFAPSTAGRGAAHHRRRGELLHVNAANFEAPTIDELKLVAKARGVELTLETFGPTFKVLCTALNADPEAPPLGVLEGFIAPFPFRLLHLDTIRIYNSRMRGAGRYKTQSPFGLSLLLGGVAFLHARENGCKKAELLAIDDNNGYAKRLVGYYTRLGFVPVRKVEEEKLADLPHRLVWGGVGTRMDADIPELVEKWARAVMARKPQAEEDL